MSSYLIIRYACALLPIHIVQYSILVKLVFLFVLDTHMQVKKACSELFLGRVQGLGHEELTGCGENWGVGLRTLGGHCWVLSQRG